MEPTRAATQEEQVMRDTPLGLLRCLDFEDVLRPWIETLFLFGGLLGSAVGLLGALHGFLRLLGPGAATMRVCLGNAAIRSSLCP